MQCLETLMIYSTNLQGPSGVDGFNSKVCAGPAGKHNPHCASTVAPAVVYPVPAADPYPVPAADPYPVPAADPYPVPAADPYPASS